MPSLIYNDSIEAFINNNKEIPVVEKLFAEEGRIERFRNMNQYLPYRKVEKGNSPFHFGKNYHDLLHVEYQFNNKKRTILDLIQRVNTTGFLVIKDDEIISEEYFHGNTESSLHTSFSMAKSYVATLVGIAVDEGLITNVNEPITEYLPELSGSGYDDVRIQDILNMVSGIDYNEDYNNPVRNGVIMFDQSFYQGQGLDKYITTLGRKDPIGTFEYKSIESQVLGMLVKKVTGKNPSKYLEEKVWKKIGMESDAYINTDAQGNDITYAYLNATLRDFARFGRLYLNDGNWNGEQIVSKDWVKSSITPTDETPTTINANLLMGYINQWWIPRNNKNGTFCTLGLWGQITYVDKQSNTIIVTNGVNNTPTGEENEANLYEKIVFCETIVNYLKNI